jgi:uncharacterized protein with HEPN domain
MTRHTAKRLLDVQQTCVEIEHFASGHSEETFLGDRGLQLILHKLLEIVGEALNQLSKEDPEMSARIPWLRRYVNLRNQISHGYETVNYSIVWEVAVDRIPILHAVVNELLAEGEFSTNPEVGTP